MATINRLPSSIGLIDESEDRTKWAFTDGSHSIDLKTADTKSLNDFKLGMAAGEILYKLDNDLLKPRGNENNINNDLADDNSYNEANNQNKSQNQGKALTLNNGHSILGDNNFNPNGFASYILVALLSGFGIGVVAATIWIFVNLGKVTFTWQ